jgi:small subunit ribosomal protein S2
MALPQFSMHDLIGAGVHFGHRTRRWNPKMAPYLYGVRNDVHIIDLQQTVPLLHQALAVVRETVANNGRILFVGTKRQASDIVAEAANHSGQYYVNQRWLGGMLTNWTTIQNSIRKLRKLEEEAEMENINLTKKERLQRSREQAKLESSLGGIKEMGGLPSLIFVIDTNRESLAVAEAAKLGIPVIGIVDSNSSVDNIDYPIPGNDDATKAIRLYCNLIANAALDGLQSSIAASDIDAGASAEVPETEAVAEEAPATEEAEAATEVVVKKSRKKAAEEGKADEAVEADKDEEAKKAS